MTDDEKRRIYLTDDEIRKRYERDGGPMGANQEAITKFIQMIRAHEKSENSCVREIIAGLDNLQSIAPNFTIFQSPDKNFFMHQFKALTISLTSSDLVMSHEFGHALLGMINGLQIPEKFEEVVERAYNHSKSTEIIPKLIEYIKRISNPDLPEVTEAEKGPVSDIISAIHLNCAFRIKGEIYILPSYHPRSYYQNEKTGERKIKQIFDECFANIYALMANNHHKELEDIKTLFGEEFFQVMNAELEKAAKTINRISEKTLHDSSEEEFRFL